jgi:two-component system CheB/CheR fusion protein
MPSSFFPVVAIGASAGGLEAYTDFFHALPVDTGMAFVLVQHLDPKHRSLLAEILSKATRMPVKEVKSGVRIRPNRVYVIPSNTFMAISEGAFTLTPRGAEAGLHLTINFFMRSLAEERRSGAIGIILSGTGADGTVGLENIKAEGGITFAQDPSTARFDAMPRSAINSGCVDFVLPPNEIAAELRRIQHYPYVRAEEQDAKEQGEELKENVSFPFRDNAFLAILDHLRKASGVDFSQYRPNTIHRRALRRMVILKLESLADYERHLKDHPEEALKLYDDVLIPVTSFFRDFEAFEALKAHVYPAIVKDKANNGTIRMWAPGCSTGEETYSLAMTLLEFLGEKASSFQVQIFGTDLNEKSIQKARSGLYRESIAEEISPERMVRFFVKAEGGYRVNKAVRDMCVFARQNVAHDPPFSQMNVVACRNLLIYIQPVLQKKIIPILHYALKPSGFLMLGGSESVSAFPDLFSPVDKKHKIYSKKEIESRLHYDFSKSYYPARTNSGIVSGAAEPQSRLQNSAKGELDVHAEADQLVLKNHAPVGVIINSAMEVVQFRGRTTPYLEPAPGKASLNLLKLARNGLAIELRTLIMAAGKDGKPVEKKGVSFGADGHRRILNLSVSPLGEKTSRENRSFLVLFDDVTPQWSFGPESALQSSARASAEIENISKRLKQELTDSQSALRSSIESEESLREEFQSANEEIISANEELQSSNEELETSKEELQSTNEELTTVNAELRHKNSELQEIGNDLSNLLNSTRIPVVMLDRNMKIRRITPAAGKLLKVVPSDIGRAIGDLKLNIDMPTLESVIAEVLETLQPWERDVKDLKDCWHSLRILPYRTQENKIDGVVLALHDIQAMKEANERLRKSSEFFRGIIDTVRQPLLVLDAELRVLAINQTFQNTFKVSQEQTVDQPLFKLGNGQWNIRELSDLLEEVLSKRHAVTDFEVEHVFDDLGRRRMLLNAATLIQANDQLPLILLAIEDITERKQAEAALIKSEKLAAAGRLAATLAHEINNPLQAVTNLMVLLEKSPKLDEADRAYATMAAEELASVTELTRQSLSFFREAAAPKAVNMEETLEGVLKLYGKRVAEKGISVVKQYRSNETILSYPGEIRQIFATLLLNAMQATKAGGSITVRLRKASRGLNRKTKGVRILISDTGIGIPAENRTRIFEPFFTTKDEQGTGLGLWVAQGIVSRLGGSIRMRSSVRTHKHGTCFSVFLPMKANAAPPDRVDDLD